MFAFVVLDLFFQYYERLAGKNVSEMTCFVSMGHKTLTQSVNLPSAIFEVRFHRLVAQPTALEN